MSFRGPTILVFLGFLSCVHADLKLGFYDDSCPKAEKMILDFVEEHIPNAPTVAASLLRMHFHDCFVRVRCNAFVSTQSCFLHGMFDAILRVVMALCSSIQPAPTKLRRPRLRTKHSAGSTSSIAWRAWWRKNARGSFRVRTFLRWLRETRSESLYADKLIPCSKLMFWMQTLILFVWRQGGPIWRVPTGRRDGLISNLSEALSEIPAPTSNLSSLQTSFANKGLNAADLVLLSGELQHSKHMPI